MTAEEVNFKTDDWKAMLELMQHHKDFPMPLCGKNGSNENIIVSINSDNITIETCQNNGWMRTNVYWNDFTTEELYGR